MTIEILMRAIELLRQRLAALRLRLAPLARRPQRWLSPHGLAWGAAALAVAGVLYLLVLTLLTPSIRDIRKAKGEQPAQLVSTDGRLLAEYKWVNREWVPLAAIAPAVVDALIATEDHRFYQHWGMDWRRTLAAVVRTAGGDRQGGSTITQQLARNLYPEEIGRAPTLNRKLKEAITALKIEWSYSKDEILETYLNTVPFLYNAYGIEMAARTYFDKSAGKLGVLESATLIGMLKGTAYYNPVLNPERAQDRRNTVLAQMKKRGKLEPAEYDKLVRRPLRIRFERQSEVGGLAPHLAQQLKRQLIEWSDRNGYSLYADGLVIRTTIDGQLQELATKAVQQHGRTLQRVADGAWAGRGVWNARNPLVQQLVRESNTFAKAVEGGESEEAALERLLADASFLQELRAARTRVQAGFLALEPGTGAVRAWVGSRDYAADPFDHVQAARRQPGSTFKPFVYGAAFAQGRRPDETLLDTAVEIPLPGGHVWRPRDGNAAPSEMPMTLADGLAYSKNTITAQLMTQVGPQRVAQLARAMGVRESPLEAVPALALGTSDVTLKEMAAAYGTIASGGRYHAPYIITRIEDASGRVLQEFVPPAPEQALATGAAQQLRDALRGVVDKGTATAIRSRYGITADVAGKTGTTQGNTDGWFILMHPQLVAGAWVGFNDARITLRSDHWGQGAQSALPIVGEFFRQALRTKVLDAKVRFVDEADRSWSSRAGEAVDALRHWAYDLFGNPAPVQDKGAGPQSPEPQRIPPPAPPEERPEISEAPLLPLESVPPRPAAPPVWVLSPEEAPAPEPGVVVPTLPAPIQGEVLPPGDGYGPIPGRVVAPGTVFPTPLPPQR
ncbi:penicillin-binding protein 1A [Oryzisolibacter propanilivorax]|uniref:Penicillin-binding protein 1A n=2 Tax=Oryzisolibacter propanilivorax TaxID=1527607 RepID=A0A1G9PH79_9BURK|nr:penicillin-binding protein 1A [Oryzisolibacter propanilivorax]